MTPPAHSTAARPELVSERIPLAQPRWLALMTSSDHKAVGKLYVGTALSFLGAALALLVMMRIQLIIPDATLIRPPLFDRLLSAYGVTAVLLFAMPLFLGLISYVVPLQIGARAASLPRLAQLSYWLYLGGAISIFAGFLWRPSEAGTLALTPLSDDLFSSNHGVDAWAIGVGMVCLALICFSISMATTIRLNRAPGMAWRRVPLFSFAVAVISWTLIVVSAVMLAAITMLLIDRNFSGVFYQPGEGGAPLLYQHLAWIFFTGIYVSLVLAAFGAISEVFSTFARRPLQGHGVVSGALVAFAVLGVLAWMQNMYTAPISLGFLYFAMLMSVFMAVPAGIVILSWIATLRGGGAEMRTPMKFALGASVLLVLGLAGEWAQSVIPVNWQVAQTGVAWGDTHMALIGAGVLGGFAALYYWFPKITGRYMGTTLAGPSLWTILIGALLMTIPIQLAGLQGMPVDVYKFYADTGMSAYNLIASIGAFLLTVGIILSLVNAAASHGGGTVAGPDAWGGSSLEWFALSPPPEHNFDLVPDVRSSAPFADIRDAVRRRSTELELPEARAAATPAPEPTAAPAAESAGATDADSDDDGSLA